MRQAVGLLGVAVALTTGGAGAFTVNSPITEGCHEQISFAAFDAASAKHRGSLTITPDANDEALIDDLPFDVPNADKELAAASLVVGVRDNDLKGHAPSELDELAFVHGDPKLQDEHCLRDAGDDEPTGSKKALDRCTTFIRRRALEALAGLDADGEPDPAVRIDLAVSLAIRGKVTASLPLFWVRIGQAMHAMQDSFSHTYRSKDGMKVTVVLDWVELVDHDEVESRDGPPHKLDLDACNSGDALTTRNKKLATEASSALLAAVLEGPADRAARADAIDAVLAKYLSYEPGCTYPNKWCDAAENVYTNTSGCEVAAVGEAGGGGPAPAWGFGMAALAALAVGARRSRRGLARIGIAIGAGIGIATMLASTPDRAQNPDDAPAPTTATPAPGPATANLDEAKKPIPPRTVGEVKEAVKESIHASPFALTANAMGSFSDPALAGSIGARFRVSERFVLGLDGELNAWYGVDKGRFELGAVNVYATGIFRFPLRFEPINLRTTLEAGISYELLDLYGVPSGSVGPFLGVYPLGLEWKASGHVFVVFNPLGLALPVPHLTGTPFTYPQFRTQLGVEIAL